MRSVERQERRAQTRETNTQMTDTNFYNNVGVRHAKNNRSGSFTH